MRCVVLSNMKWGVETAKKLGKRLDAEILFINDPTRFNRTYLDTVKPDYILVLHWSSIIPEDIYGKYETIIFHMTDVPYGRGGSPLQNLVVRGHRSTKISALRCVKELDAGSVYLKRNLSLDGNAEQIFIRASDIIVDMIEEIVISGIKPVDQIGKPVYFKRRKPKEGSIEGLTNIGDVYDYIRMLDADGYPRAYLDCNRLHLEFDDAKQCDNCVDARVRISIKKNRV
jgi:methionyl-tRNA formyltransferase